MRASWLVMLLPLGCNPISNKGLGDTNYLDNDGDGYSVAEGDCDDSNNAIHPDALEACDQVDWDCDGLTMEPDATALLEDEGNFLWAMRSPNKLLPLDSVPCVGTVDNPMFWVLPQLQYAGTSVDGAGCTGSEIGWSTVSSEEDSWGLYNAEITATTTTSCSEPAFRLEYFTDISRYETLTIRYRWSGQDPLVLNIEHGSGSTPSETDPWQLDATGSEWSEEVLNLSDATAKGADLASWRALEFVLPESATLELDYLIFEADSSTWQENDILCCRGEQTDPPGCSGKGEFLDLACHEPATSATSLGLAASHAAVSYTIGLEPDHALETIEAVVSFLEETPGWKGEDPGEPWTPGGFIQSWFSPFSGAPYPGDKLLTLIHNGTLAAGLIACREAMREDEEALGERIQALLDAMDWTLFAEATAFRRVDGCGLADGSWFSKDCLYDEENYQNVRVGDDTLLASFLLRVFGGFDNADWSGLDCSLDTWPLDETPPTWRYYTAGAYEIPEPDTGEPPLVERPLLGSGGLYMPLAALPFLDPDRLPMYRGHPSFSASARQATLAQHSEAGAAGFWGWGSSRAVQSCEYLGGLDAQDPAPYNALMAVEYAPEEVSELACTLADAGLNRSFIADSRVWYWGYRDAIDEEDSSFNEQGFILTHKAWIWLAWAQHAHGPVLRDLFASHPAVAKAYTTIHPACTGQRLAEGGRVKPAGQPERPVDGGLVND